MERAFRIALSCAVVFAILSYGCYRIILYTVAIGEGGDALGPLGLLALMAMIILIVLFIASAASALGYWIVRLNSSKLDSTTIELR